MSSLLTTPQVVFFAKTSELHVLNKAIIYARDNELCDRIIICHVHLPQIILPPEFCHGLPSINYSLAGTSNLSPTSTPQLLQTPPPSIRKNIPRELFEPLCGNTSGNAQCGDLMYDNLDSLQHFCSTIISEGRSEEAAAVLGNRQVTRLAQWCIALLCYTFRFNLSVIYSFIHYNECHTCLISTLTYTHSLSHTHTHSHTLPHTHTHTYTMQTQHGRSRDWSDPPNMGPNDPVPTATAQIPLRLQENLQLLDHMYPKTKVRTHACTDMHTHTCTYFFLSSFFFLLSSFFFLLSSFFFLHSSFFIFLLSLFSFFFLLC